MRFREKGKTHLVTLDLFTGIAGITRALEGICVPAAYCDISESARITLRRLMQKGLIPRAPISPDVTSLDKSWIQQNCGPRTQKIDMIVAGFPCIGFSPVGLRKGFENPQSFLFQHILRLIDETRCPMVFLENVPNIIHLGMPYIVKELTWKRGFELRWHVVSARDVGAPHKRDRWFCVGMRDKIKVKPATHAPSAKYDLFPWSKNEPMRLQTQWTRRHAQQLALLGNSVVPDAVRYAFFVLALRAPAHHLSRRSENALHTPSRMLFAPCTQITKNNGTKKKTQLSRPHLFSTRFPSRGMITRDRILTTFPKLAPLRVIEHSPLVFDPSLYKSPHQASSLQTAKRLTAPVRAISWSTPRYRNTMASNYITERTVRDLPTQVRFEVRSTRTRDPKKDYMLRHKGKISTHFVEHLMGYPPGWTDA